VYVWPIELIEALRTPSYGTRCKSYACDPYLTACETSLVIDLLEGR
jgi:hypothetical protein